MRRPKLLPTLEGCPVGTTLTVIGGKWKGILLYHLLESPRRFGEFRKLYPDITPFMLTLQLRELERDGIVHREAYPEVPPRVEYSLTEFGKTLAPVILFMKNWGEAHGDQLKDSRTRHAEKKPE